MDGYLKTVRSVYKLILISNSMTSILHLLKIIMQSRICLKNIPEKIMALMKNNAFLKEFNMLKLDEIVDITLLKKT